MRGKDRIFYIPQLGKVFRLAQVENFFPIVSSWQPVKAVYIYQAWHMLADAVYLIQNILSADEHVFDLGIFKNELELFCIGSGINRAKNGPYLLTSQVQDYPFRPVLADDGYFILALNIHVSTGYA